MKKVIGSYFFHILFCYYLMLLLAQYTERGKGILGSGIELGGLFNNVKINVDSYQKVIDDFKKIGDFSKYWEKDKFNWDAIAKAIEGCDETALSYFKTLYETQRNSTLRISKLNIV